MTGATTCSTQEPCAQRVLAAAIPRVVIVWREPSLLVDDRIGKKQLIEAGVVMAEVPGDVEPAGAVNAHPRRWT